MKREIEKRLQHNIIIIQSPLSISQVSTNDLLKQMHTKPKTPNHICMQASCMACIFIVNQHFIEGRSVWVRLSEPDPDPDPLDFLKARLPKITNPTACPAMAERKTPPLNDMTASMSM